VADYLGQALWRLAALAQKYGQAQQERRLDRIAIRRHRRPPDLPQIRSAIGRLRQGSGRSAGILDLCRKLQKAGKPAGFALGNARGDGNGLPTGAVVAQRSLLDEEGNVVINSKETIAALNWVKETVPDLQSPVRRRGNDVSNRPRLLLAGNLADRQRRLAVLLAEERSGDKAIADDSEHQLLPKGLAKISPMAGLTLNAMLFKHSPYPNAAKAIPAIHAGKGSIRAVAQRQLGLLGPSARGLCRRRGLVRRSKGADLQETP